MIKFDTNIKLNNNLKKIDEQIDELLENEDIKSFVANNDLNGYQIEEAVNRFLLFLEEKENCKECLGLQNCKNANKGYSSELALSNDRVKILYYPCQYLSQIVKKEATNENLNSLYIPKKVLNASFDDLYLINEERKEINKYLTRFLAFYSKEEPMKGIYISGMYGTGKTYILAALCNELTKKGHKVMFAYYPDLSRELKSCIDKGNLEEMIQQLKEIEILMLDDIGGESISQYIRDEVLGPILQYRLLEELPTFFSSNLSIDDLRNQYRRDGSKEETVRSLRIYERIKDLTVEFELTKKPVRPQNF